MKVITINYPHNSRADEFKFSFVGDIHLGAADCDIDLLRRVMKKLSKAENHRWFGMGDYGEYIGIRDKRFDAKSLPKDMKATELDNIFGKQTDQVVEELSVARDTCDGLIEGNHDKDAAIRYGKNFYQDVCERLKLRELGYCCVVKINFSRGNVKNPHVKQVRFLLHHGYGGGRREGTKMNKAEDLMWINPYCQLYVMGHVHGKSATVKNVVDVHRTKDELVEKAVGYGISGVFKRTYTHNFSSYAEIKAYPTSSLGCITFTIIPYNYEKGGKDSNSITIKAHNSSDGMPE